MNHPYEHRGALTLNDEGDGLSMLVRNLPPPIQGRSSEAKMRLNSRHIKVLPVNSITTPWLTASADWCIYNAST
jgi:hypothetical protein